jgi:hypothetical protein
MTGAFGTATAVALALLAGCAAEKRLATALPLPSTAPSEHGHASGQVTVTGHVLAVDRKRRLVTLRRPDGSEVTVVVDPKVKRFEQIKAGDDVTATYYESVALQLRKTADETPGNTTADAIGAARAGDLPAGVTVQATTITATITAVDPDAQTVTVRDPRGRTRTVKGHDRKTLAGVQVGDVVELTYTEAVAVAVDTPEKPPKR